MKRCPLVRIPAQLLGSSLSALALLALAPAPAWCQSVSAAVAAVPNPKIMFERSSLVGIDNAIIAYGVPISVSDKVINCYDVTVAFTATGNGSVPTTAKVSGVPCPVVSPRGIVAGAYTDAPAYKASCLVTNYALQIGRTEAIIKCTEDYGYHTEITLVNGAIDKDHPFYANLVAAKIDKRTDTANFVWGLVTVAGGVSNLGGCGSFAQGRPVGAQQVGNEIRLWLFDTGGNIVCIGGIHK